MAAAFLTLVRWPNVLLAALGVVVGAVWTSWAGMSIVQLLAAVVAASSLTVVANTWNAITDRTIDARSHPEWPIPSGAVSTQAAGVLALAAAVLAVASSAEVSIWMTGAAAAVIALLLAYSPLKQRSGLAANTLAAMLASSPFLFGAWAAGAPARALPLVAAAIPMHFAREVAKDIQDMHTDGPDRRTLPLVVGVDGARRIVLLASLAAICVLAALIVRWPRAAWGLVPAAFACASGAWRTLSGHTDAPGWFKAGMAGAIAGLLAAAALPA